MRTPVPRIEAPNPRRLSSTRRALSADELDAMNQARAAAHVQPGRTRRGDLPLRVGVRGVRLLVLGGASDLRHPRDPDAGQLPPRLAEYRAHYPQPAS
jgi:hypothetical protein